jgi:hypothetical protein
MKRCRCAEVEVLIWRSEVQRRCRGAEQGAEVQIWDMGYGICWMCRCRCADVEVLRC